jgi:hypothetical protein
LKKQLKRLKIVLGLLVTLALALPVAMAVPVLAAPPTFTGNVETDFTGPGVLIINDPFGDVGMPGSPPGDSGWDIKDLRLFYYAANDTMYVGINTFTILGDADGDGNPSVTSTYLSLLGGTDVANLGQSETAAVYFDLNQNGTWDVIAGISGITDYSGFSVNVFTGLFDPPHNFGTPLPGNKGTISHNPDTGHPDLEFTMTNWSALPGQDASPGFKVGAFLGSLQDAGIGEDSLQASFSPAINIVKKTNGTDNNSAPGPSIAVNATVTWTYNVTNLGSENLTSIVVTDDNGTPANSADDWHPAYVSGDINGDSILQTTEAWLYQASGNAKAGQYGNNATVTGYFAGLPVTDIDPDHYSGSGPSIDVKKYVKDNAATWQDADSAPGPSIPSTHTPVIFKFTIHNTGNVALTSVNLTDTDMATFYTDEACTNSTSFPTTLAVNETKTYYGKLAWAQGQQSDTATAIGAPSAGSPVSDSDPAYYVGNAPPPPPVGWETHPINKLRVLLPWIALLAAIIVGASLLVLRHRRAQT